MSASSRRLSPIAATTPARAAASAQATAPGRLSDTGFSQMKGFPAVAHASACSSCAEVEDAMITASTASSARAASGERSAIAPVRAGKRFGAADLPIDRRIRAANCGCAATLRACTVPMVPAPMTAKQVTCPARD